MLLTVFATAISPRVWKHTLPIIFHLTWKILNQNGVLSEDNTPDTCNYFLNMKNQPRHQTIYQAQTVDQDLHVSDLRENDRWDDHCNDRRDIYNDRLHRKNYHWHGYNDYNRWGGYPRCYNNYDNRPNG